MWFLDQILVVTEHSYSHEVRIPANPRRSRTDVTSPSDWKDQLLCASVVSGCFNRKCRDMQQPSRYSPFWKCNAVTHHFVLILLVDGVCSRLRAQRKFWWCLFSRCTCTVHWIKGRRAGIRYAARSFCPITACYKKPDKQLMTTVVTAVEKILMYFLSTAWF